MDHKQIVVHLFLAACVFAIAIGAQVPPAMAESSRRTPARSAAVSAPSCTALLSVAEVRVETGRVTKLRQLDRVIRGVHARGCRYELNDSYSKNDGIVVISLFRLSDAPGKPFITPGSGHEQMLNVGGQQAKLTILSTTCCAELAVETPSFGIYVDDQIRFQAPKDFQTVVLDIADKVVPRVVRHRGS